MEKKDAAIKQLTATTLRNRAMLCAEKGTNIPQVSSLSVYYSTPECAQLLIHRNSYDYQRIFLSIAALK
jgi:hypothetical protein